MKRDLLFVLICFLLLGFIAFNAKAQVGAGSFGGLYAGPAYHINASLQKKLSSEDILGSAFKGNVMSIAYGVEGYSLRDGGFIIGGSAHTSSFSSGTSNGSVTQRISSGFLIIGYTVVNTKHVFAFPYWGVGAFGTDFKITNYGGKALMVDRDSIITGKSGKYSAGGMAFDFGFALKYFMSSTQLKSGKNLKSMLGINAGVSFFPAFQKWQNVNTETRIESFNTPFIMSLYARLTLGLGIFTKL